MERRCLALVANNSRYLILPGPDFPNLASRVLALCCDPKPAQVVEITRETTVLRGKNKGKTSIERIIYICRLEPDEARGDELLERIRRYWDIEGFLHQRL